MLTVKDSSWCNKG